MTVKPQAPSTEATAIPEPPNYRLGRTIFAVLFLGASLVFLASVVFFALDALGYHPLGG